MLKQKESLIQQAEALKTIPIDIEARTVEKVRVCILDELAFAKSIWPGDAPLNAGQFEEGKFGLSPETLEAARFIIRLLFEATE